MAHTPVNHPARPVYRAIGGLVGLYFVVFGVLGIIACAGNDVFAQDDTTVLGQGTNLGSSLLSAVLGVAILAGVGIGRNLDVAINQWLAYALLLGGLLELAILQTSANILNWSALTVIVVLVLAVVLLMAGMYGRVGTEEEKQAWQKSRLVL